MPPIPASPTDNNEKDDGKQEEDGISPLLSRAPPLSLPSSYPGNTSPPPPPPSLRPASPPFRNSAIEDTIPDEHKRIPIQVPRSPLSPLRVGFEGLGIMSRSLTRSFRSRNNNDNDKKKKPMPPPIVVVHPPAAEKNTGFKEMLSPAVQSATATIVDNNSALPSPGPVTPSAGKKERRTVWGFIEGWWDLGLLERMGTVRRKKENNR
jgi:hypothetical protein